MRTSLVIVGLGIAALAAGCGSSGSSGAASTSQSASVIPTPTPTHHHKPTPIPTVTVTVTPTPTPTVTVTHTSAPAVSRCQSSNLALSYGISQGTAGTVYQVIVVTNNGASACELHGHPGVSFDDAAGHIVGQSASRDAGKVKTITLAGSGGQANALLRIPDAGNFPAASCQKQTATQTRVYPPGETVPLFLPGKTTVCTTSAGRAGIGPILAGNGG